MRESCWTEYYSLSKKQFEIKNKSKIVQNLYDITISEHNLTDPIVQRDENYFNIINDLSNKVNNLFTNPNNFTKRAHCLALDNIWNCENELKQLGNFLVPQLQEKVFGSYVHTDNIKIYRNFTSNERDSSSWLWHFDNNPKEQIKILIYLTDVESDCGEFTYLIKNGEGLKVPTSRVSYPDRWIEPWENNPPPAYRLKDQKISWLGGDRVDPYFINKLINEHGFKIYSATGKKGTLFLFDNNIIHKATIPKNKYRDVIVMQFKPSSKKISPFINRFNTGNGWQHTTFNKDPSVLQVKEA